MRGRGAIRGATLIEMMIVLAMLGIFLERAWSSRDLLSASGTPGHEVMQLEAAMAAVDEAMAEIRLQAPPLGEVTLSPPGAEMTITRRVEAIPRPLPISDLMTRGLLPPAALRIELEARWREGKNEASRRFITFRGLP